MHQKLLKCKQVYRVRGRGVTDVTHYMLGGGCATVACKNGGKSPYFCCSCHLIWLGVNSDNILPMFAIFVRSTRQ